MFVKTRLVLAINLLLETESVQQENIVILNIYFRVKETDLLVTWLETS